MSRTAIIDDQTADSCPVGDVSKPRPTIIRRNEFAQLAVLEDGRLRDEGKIGVTPEALRAWADGLHPDDQVALEATGNSDAIANLLTPLVGRVVVSNPSKTRAIAEAKVKTDKVDARIVAQLLAADFLPPVWLPDERTRSLRRQVMRRAHIVRQRTRIKNQVHAILARNLAPTPPVTDLFGRTGRHWLSRQTLPVDERCNVAALLGQLDFHGSELAVVDKQLAVEALTDPMVARLMTIPGVEAIAGIFASLDLPGQAAERRAVERQQVRVVALHLYLEGNLVSPIYQGPWGGEHREKAGIVDAEQAVEPDLGHAQLGRELPRDAAVRDARSLHGERVLGKLIELPHRRGE